MLVGEEDALAGEVVEGGAQGLQAGGIGRGDGAYVEAGDAVVHPEAGFVGMGGEARKRGLQENVHAACGGFAEERVELFFGAEGVGIGAGRTCGWSEIRQDEAVGADGAEGVHAGGGLRKGGASGEADERGVTVPGFGCDVVAAPAGVG